MCCAINKKNYAHHYNTTVVLPRRKVTRKAKGGLVRNGLVSTCTIDLLQHHRSGVPLIGG